MLCCNWRGVGVPEEGCGVDRNSGGRFLAAVRDDFLD